MTKTFADNYKYVYTDLPVNFQSINTITGCLNKSEDLFYIRKASLSITPLQNVKYEDWKVLVESIGSYLENRDFGLRVFWKEGQSDTRKRDIF